MTLADSETAQLLGAPAARRVRLAYLVSHPIQYQAPLLRRIAQEPDIDLTVFFGSDMSVRGYRDEGFGVRVEWDVPLLEGYRHVFLPKLRDGDATGVATPLNYGILSRLRGRSGEQGGGPQANAFDALWVHGYATVNTLHGMIAAKALGIPVLLRAESWLRDRGRRWLKLAFKRACFAVLGEMVDAVLPIGTLNAEYWRHYFGERVPQFPMPYAVDNRYFAKRAGEARARRTELQAELGLDPAQPVILFASKLQQRKQCGQLIEAYERLARRRSGVRDASLVIVGDGEQRAALERQAGLTGLDGIRFCGFRNQSELPRFFDLATVFVLPSRDEPWGLVVNEAMNARRAVIVSDEVGCAPDLIEDGVNGCVYRAGDMDALADALQRVLAMPGVAEGMGGRASERIARWSFEEDVQGLRQALAHVVTGFEA
jgi:glycosyltransferase involved in cell wall biosynthesis